MWRQFPLFALPAPTPTPQSHCSQGWGVFSIPPHLLTGSSGSTRLSKPSSSPFLTQKSLLIEKASKASHK